MAKFPPRAGIMHSLAGIENGPLRAGEHGGRALYLRRIRTEARRLHRFIVERLRHLLVPHIGRNLDDDGTASPVAQA